MIENLIALKQLDLYGIILIQQNTLYFHLSKQNTCQYFYNNSEKLMWKSLCKNCTYLSPNMSLKDEEGIQGGIDKTKELLEKDVWKPSNIEASIYIKQNNVLTRHQRLTNKQTSVRNGLLLLQLLHNEIPLTPKYYSLLSLPLVTLQYLMVILYC